MLVMVCSLGKLVEAVPVSLLRIHEAEPVLVVSVFSCHNLSLIQKNIFRMSKKEACFPD
jgi:hypothetical protein